MKTVNPNTTRYILIGFACMVLLFGLGDIFATYHKTSYSHCTVTGKDRTTDHNGDSHMRVYSSCGTFEVSDSILMMRYSSADFYGKIEVNKTYDFVARGFRNPVFSIFPNISEMHEVKK